MLGDFDAMATIAVKNLKAARKFYEDKLGFKVVHTEGEEAVAYKSGKSQLLVYRSQYAGTNKATAATWMVKDVDGLYTSDPKSADGVRPERFERLGWEKALGIGGGVVQVKALEFARENRVRFEVAAVGRAEGTVVGEEVP